MAMLDAKSAGDERRKFIKRSKEGKRGKARAGKPYCGGHVPYGYKVVPDGNGKGAYFEIAETEAEVVRLIFGWYTQGNGDGKPMGIRAIAGELKRMGIPTPGEVQRRERDKLQDEIESEGLTNQDIEDALRFQQAVRVGLEDPTWEGKRYYLETLRFEARIRMDGKAKFTCYLDVKGNVFDLQSQVHH